MREVEISRGMGKVAECVGYIQNTLDMYMKLSKNKNYFKKENILEGQIVLHVFHTP